MCICVYSSFPLSDFSCAGEIPVFGPIPACILGLKKTPQRLFLNTPAWLLSQYPHLCHLYVKLCVTAFSCVHVRCVHVFMYLIYLIVERSNSAPLVH